MFKKTWFKKMLLTWTILVFSVFLFNKTFKYIQSSNLIPDSTWSNTKGWELCADSFRENGVFLAVKSGDKFIPASNISLGDDIGHNLFLSFFSKYANRQLKNTDFANFNLFVVLCGIILSTYFLFSQNMVFGAVLFLLLSPSLIENQTSISPHYSNIGVALVILVFLCTTTIIFDDLISSNENKKHFLNSKSAKLINLFFISFFLAFCATLIRGSYVAILLGASFSYALALFICFYTKKFKPNKKLILFAILYLCGLILISCSSQVVLSARDLIWKIEPSKFTPTHGFAHNLTIGLGVVDNKFNIKWDDSKAFEIAKEIDPNSEYMTKQYFKNLWQAYLGFWKTDPVEVIRIYKEKAKLMLNEKIFNKFQVWIVLLLSISLVLLLSTLYIKGHTNIKNYLFFHFLGLLVFLFIVFQGIAAHFARQYWQPLEAIFVFHVSIMCDLIFKQNFRKIKIKTNEEKIQTKRFQVI